MDPINATSILVVRLEAQQWNIVLAGVNELPIKVALQVYQALLGQLQEQAPMANGFDSRAEVRHDPVQ